MNHAGASTPRDTQALRTYGNLKSADEFSCRVCIQNAKQGEDTVRFREGERMCIPWASAKF